MSVAWHCHTTALQGGLPSRKDYREMPPRDAPARCPLGMPPRNYNRLLYCARPVSVSRTSRSPRSPSSMSTQPASLSTLR